MLSTWEVSKEHIMGLNLRQPFGPMSKGVVYTPMRGYMMFPSAPVEGKYFANPNFVNGNNPSLLGRKDFYRTAKETKEELVTTTEVQQKQQQQQEVNKRRRKRGRRNRRKNKQTAITTTNKKESRVPQLTESFRNISVRQEIQKEAVKEASRTRVPSLSESEDSFIVFDDQGAEDEESAIESDPELTVEESTEVSETDGASSDSCIPQKKVSAGCVHLFCFRTPYLVTFLISRCFCNQVLLDCRG